jgi:hypothetical protein
MNGAGITGLVMLVLGGFSLALAVLMTLGVLLESTPAGITLAGILWLSAAVLGGSGLCLRRRAS